MEQFIKLEEKDIKGIAGSTETEALFIAKKTHYFTGIRFSQIHL